MIINMSELFTADGTKKEYDIPLGFSEMRWERRTFPVTSSGCLHLTLVHESKRKVSVIGSIVLHMEIPCDRCLEPVDVPFDLAIERDIDANATSEERIAQLDEQPYVDGFNLDTDMLVRDELMLNMPMKVLCSEDCKGVCPKCGANLNLGDCGCSQEDLDPRMAVIRDIFKNSNHGES